MSDSLHNGKGALRQSNADIWSQFGKWFQVICVFMQVHYMRLMSADFPFKDSADKLTSLDVHDYNNSPSFLTSWYLVQGAISFIDSLCLFKTILFVLLAVSECV